MSKSIENTRPILMNLLRESGAEGITIYLENLIWNKVYRAGANLDMHLERNFKKVISDICYTMKIAEASSITLDKVDGPYTVVIKRFLVNTHYYYIILYTLLPVTPRLTRLIEKGIAEIKDVNKNIG